MSHITSSAGGGVLKPKPKRAAVASSSSVLVTSVSNVGLASGRRHQQLPQRSSASVRTLVKTSNWLSGGGDGIGQDLALDTLRVGNLHKEGGVSG